MDPNQPRKIMKHKKMSVKADARVIVKRLTARNPELKDLVRTGDMALEDFAEVIILQWRAFNHSR